MNLTELARILRVTPQELRDKLPLLGFDIGQRAIKIDHKIAQKIIKDWSFLNRQLELKNKAAMDAKRAEQGQEPVVKKEVKIPNIVTVKDFASLAGLPVSKVLAELMKNGIFVALNEKVDFDTAAIVGSELGLNIILDEAEAMEEHVDSVNKLKDIIDKEHKDHLLNRAPIVVIMGHVDHGKTTLLDAIRNTSVVSGEAGGITQHIGAYQIIKKDRPITFIDTPGHEAFTAMRSRGAKVADIAILVVAADDGVKPQTVEALNIIKAAKVPFIVAINKIDKPEANIDKTKQELSTKLNITPEDWGGQTVCAPISAKNNIGIDALLDVILLTADMEVDNIKANPDAPAVGTIIESRVDKGEGPVATILIQNGTLRVGDQLCFNGIIFGKAKALKNYRGESIVTAGPSMPAKIIGLKIVPRVGDILEVGLGERADVRSIKNSNERQQSKYDQKDEDDADSEKIKLIIKSDFLGSAEAIEESLEKINTNKVKVKIIHKGLGNIVEGDIKRAEDTGAIVIGFNVKAPTNIEQLAREKKVEIKTYHVIYDLINNMRDKMQELLKPEVVRVDLGKLKILGVFRTEKNSQIVGGKVIEGMVEDQALIEVLHQGELVARGKLAKLQAGKQDVKSVDIGQECGLQYEGSPIIQMGDELLFYREDTVFNKA